MLAGKVALVRASELLVIALLLAALYAVGSRAYWDHQNREIVRSAMAAATPARAAVTRNAAARSPRLGSGFTPAPLPEGLRSLTVDDSNGRVTLEFTLIEVPVELNRLVLVPSRQGVLLSANAPVEGPIDWTCDSERTTIPSQFRPEMCR